MKKIIYSIFAIAALAACNKAEAPEQTAAFRINVNLNSTKPVFDQDTYKVSWKADEQLHVLINGDAYTFVKTQDSDYSFECADFHPVDSQTYNWEIVTPYRSDYGEKTFSFSGGVGPVMYGTGTSVGTATPSIHMALLNSIVRLEIENTGETDITINQFRFESDTDSFGGRRTIVDGEVVLKEGVDPVKYTALTSGNDLTVKAGETGYKCLQCGPFVATTGSKLTVTLTAGSDKYTKVISVDAEHPVEFKAGKVKTTHIDIAKEAPQPTGDKKVYVDFGSDENTDAKWNTIKTHPIEGRALVDGDGNATNLTITASGFSSVYAGPGGEPKVEYTEADITFPKCVYKDSYMIANATTTGTVVISGCDNTTYTVKALAFRYNGSRQIRITKFNVHGTEATIDTGARSESDMNNNSFVAVFENVTPVDGKITLQVSAIKDTRDDVINGFLNAIVIEKN